MRGTHPMGAPISSAAAGLALATLLLACEPEPVKQARPPHCEPEGELQIERTLKRAYRALARGQHDEARAEFQEVLKLDGQHPQAREGLRALEASKAGARPAGTRVRSSGIAVGGRSFTLGPPVNGDRYRFEEEQARREVLRRLRGDPEADSPEPLYGQRRGPQGAPMSPTDAEAALGYVDLVVLFDSHTVTAREAFLTASQRGEATHFLIDYDGQVFQALDLALDAGRVGVEALDRRAVVVEIVNPVELDRPQLPGGVGEHRREKSPAVVVQGLSVRHWTYTEAQTKSLSSLLVALRRLLPACRTKLPRGEDGKVLRGVLPPERRDGLSGVIGHLHVDDSARDPGAGFDWEALAQLLE